MKFARSTRSRWLAVSLAASLTAIGTIGCAPQSGGSSDDTIDIWIRPGLFSPETIDNLEAQFPDADIEVLETPDVEPKLRAALRANTGVPDIVMLGGNVPDYYVSEDSFVDLGDYGWSDVEGDYVDWKVDLGTSPSGRVIAAPLDTGPYVFFYRTDVMEELGYPSDPESVGEQVSTWEGYTDLVTEVAATERFACDTASSILTLSHNQDGFAYFEAEGDEFVPTVDTPVLEENYLRAADYATEGLCAGVTPGSAEWNAAAAQGSLVGFTGPIYYQNGLQTTVTDSAGLWRITTTPGGAASAKGSFIAVTAEAGDPELSAEIIYWLSNAENQTATYRDVGSYPSTPDSLDDEPFLSGDEFYGGQVLVETLQPILEAAPLVVVGPFGDNVSAVFKDSVTDLEVNGGDPQDAYDQAVQDAMSALGE